MRSCSRSQVLLHKRWTCIKRDPKTLLSQHLLPVGLVGLTLLILTLDDPNVGPPLPTRAEIFLRSRFQEDTPPPTQFVANRPNTSEL